MGKRTEEAIDRLVSDWPPLTEETKGKLRDALQGDAPPARQEWIERQLANRPERSEEWKDETRRQWGLKAADPDDSEYRRVVRDAAMSRPPLTDEQAEELARIIQASRARRSDA